MAYFNVTGTGASTVYPTATPLALIQINTGFTGTITVTDGAVPVAIITNPAAGNSFIYWDIKTNVTINPSAVGDITVMIDSGRRR